MDKQLNRHEFFQSVARGGIMAGIVGVGAAALHGTREVSECFQHNYCSSCWAFDGCGLPEKIADAQPVKAKEISHG